MLEKNIYEFLEAAGPIFFVTPTANRAIGLERELPDFHIIAAQNSPEIALLKKAGVKVFCLNREIKNAGKMLLEAEVVSYIRANSRGQRANILTFKPSPMIEKVCAKNGFRYLGNDAQLGREFEDKIKFAGITSELGVPNAHSRIIKLNDENMSELISSLDFSENRSYVIQFARGYSGNSTFIVANPGQWKDILADNIGRKMKLADFVPGDTYTFDVCLGEFGVRISPPIFQITGFAQFNRNPLGTCGNDYAFGRELDADLRTAWESSIRKVAGALLARGYRGLLGFDFVLGEREVHLIEVNPRLVGSVPVYTKLQLGSGETPFLLLHLLSFLDYDFSRLDAGGEGKDFMFSQLILRNTQAETKQVSTTLVSGVYKLGPAGLALQREAYGVDAPLAPDEFLLAIAGQGAAIDPDMEYANLQLPYGIMETRDRLKTGVGEIAAEVLSKITLE